MIQATFAVYPLGQEGFRAIERAIEALESFDVAYEVRPMQTELTGTPDDVFAALRAAFDAAAEEGGIVAGVTLSNACPLPGEDD